MKKTFFLLLGTLLFLFFVGINVYSKESKTFKNYVSQKPTYIDDTYTNGFIFEFNEETNTYSVIGYEGTDTVLIIPNTYRGYPVTHIHFKDETLTENIYFEEIILPESLLNIGTNTFNCDQFSELSEVIILINCQDIAWGFYNYSMNIDIIIPDDHNFLKEEIIDDVSIIMSKDGKEIIFIPNTTNQDKVLTIPAGIEKINDAAAAYTNYKEIILPEGLKYIGDNAFINTTLYRDDKLPTVINIPDSVEHIGKRAFQGSYSSSELILPRNLKTVGSMAFSYNNINTITIYPSLTQFNYIFGDIKFEESNQINQVTTIIIEGLNLEKEALDNFIQYFVSTNFIENYEDITVTIVLPNDNTRGKVKKAIKSSLDYAIQKNPGIDYPKFTFEPEHDGNVIRYIGLLVLVLILITMIFIYPHLTIWNDNEENKNK